MTTQISVDGMDQRYLSDADKFGLKIWPTRYRSVYLAWGPNVRTERLPEMSIKDIVQRLATMLGVSFTALTRH